MMSLVVGLKKTRLILVEDYLVLLLCLGCPGLRWMFSDPHLLQKFWLFHLRLGIWIFHLSLAITLSLHWAFGRGVQMRPSAPILQCLRPKCLLSDSTRVQCITEKNTWQEFCSKLMHSRFVFRRNRVIFDHSSKRYYWSVKRHSEPPFIGCLPIRQEILNVSQIAVAFHGICPPIFFQTWLQQYCRCPFLYSAHCSFSNPIRFRSVRCWRTMVPRYFFTELAKF